LAYPEAEAMLGSDPQNGKRTRHMTRPAHAGNLLADLPDAAAGEVFTELLVRPGCRIERIVSQGQVTPPDMPY